jgi:hypothetical protein
MSRASGRRICLLPFWIRYGIAFVFPNPLAAVIGARVISTDKSVKKRLDIVNGLRYGFSIVGFRILD